MGITDFNTAGSAPATTSLDLTFCTGTGQHDTRKDDGRGYDGITGKEIVKLVKDPPALPKDKARWLIPSTYRASDARGHDAQRQHGAFWFLALDVDANNLSLEAVADAVEKVAGRCTWMIYATRSATADNRKWRALVPLMLPISGADYADTQAAFFDLLEDATQGELIPDRALCRPGQLVYLPNRGDFYDYKAVKGNRLELLDLHPIIKRRNETRKKRAQAEAEAKAWRDKRRAEMATDPGESIVERFNADHDLQTLLEHYGYKRAGRGDDWRSPYQSSGSYATRAAPDHWISLSDSDARAELGRASKTGARFGDAFDLFVHFDHGGDDAAAVKAYAKEIGEDHASKRQRAQDDIWKLFGEKIEADRPGQNAGTEAGQKPKPGFTLIRADHLEFREPNYLVAGLIEAETLGLIFGDPGSGKSFAALDVAASVATGRDFHGREVKKGAVIYICGEGQNGIKRRLTAWERHHGVSLTGAPLYVSRVAAAFLNTESVKAVVAAIDAAAREAGDVGLIVIDTLNRNMGPGDESSTSDMTSFVTAVDAVKDRYGATALVVHHTGHGNKERARGSMALLGALDTEYRIKKDDDLVTMHCTKMKDGAAPPPLAFRMVEIEVGRTRLDEPITSAALTETEASTPSCKRDLPAKVRQALNSFMAAKAKAGHGNDPSQGVHVEDWRKAFYEHSTADTAEAKKKAFQRYRDDLVAREILSVRSDVYRLASVPPGVEF
jgi:hypothetical protein